MDALADLPLPVLLDWMEYARMTAPGAKEQLSPTDALSMFKKQFGG